jgi:pimeloyl-ACP methyl ester carboxylesterase
VNNNETIYKFAESIGQKLEIRRIHYQGKPIQTYSFGQGEKTVFSFPAYPHSGVIYLKFLEQYPEANVRFITFDLPGWIGMSENVFLDTEFTMSECVKIALKILEEYEVESYGLIGYSFGTALATILSYYDFDRVTRLALVSPVVNCRLMEKSWNMVKVNIAQKLGIGEFVGIYIRYRYAKYKNYLRKAGYPEEFIVEYQKYFNAANGKVLLDSLYKLFHGDLSLYFNKLSNKKVLVVNSKDETDMFKKQAEYIRRILKEENSLYITGSHEDFVLKGNPIAAKHVLRFLAEELL